MRIKVIETFEYEAEVEDIKDLFTIKDYVECVDDMSCPFWDGQPSPENLTRTDFDYEIIDNS